MAPASVESKLMGPAVRAPGPGAGTVLDPSLLEHLSRTYRSGVETDLEIMEWVDQWVQRCGLVEALDSQGTSLWWFARFHLLNDFLALLPDLRAFGAALDRADGKVRLDGADRHWLRVSQVAAEGKGTARELGQVGPGTSLRSTIEHGAAAGVTLMRLAAGVTRRRRTSTGTGVAALIYSVCKRVSVGDEIRYMEPTFEPVLDELTSRGLAPWKLNAPTAHGWRNELRWLRKGDPTAVPVELAYLGWRVRTGMGRRHSVEADVLARLPSVLSVIDRTPAAWHGVDLGPELRRFARAVLIPRVRRAVREIGFFHDLLARARPRTVLLSNEYAGLAMAATVAAQRLGIPVVALQHGVIWRAHPGYVLPRRWVGSIPKPNALCVFGGFERELVCAHGIYAPNEIFVTGSPRMDFVSRSAPALSRRELVARLQLRADAPIVLFTSTGESRMLAERLALLASGSTAPLALVVKLHPTGEVEPQAYTAVTTWRAAADLRVIGEEVDLYDLLRVVDVHMSMNSTVLTEATVFDLPNIMVATDTAADKVGYLEREVAVRAEDYPTLSDAVEDVLRGPAAERLRRGRTAFVASHFHTLDGGATTRAADVVERFLARGR